MQATVSEVNPREKNELESSMDTPLVSNALELFQLGYLDGSPLRNYNKEFLAALFLSAPSPLSWKQIVDATFQESPILCFRLVESFTEMINDGYIVVADERYSAHSNLFACLKNRFSVSQS